MCCTPLYVTLFCCSYYDDYTGIQNRMQLKKQKLRRKFVASVWWFSQGSVPWTGSTKVWDHNYRIKRKPAFSLLWKSYHGKENAGYFYASGIFWMIVLFITTKNITDTISEQISAIGNDHHTAWSPPIEDRIYAAGTSTTSWRIMDTIMLKIAFPRAWKTVPAIMQNHAIR